jgi:protein-export membrane protein SecD
MARSKKEKIAIAVSVVIVLIILSYPIVNRIIMSPERVFARKGGLQITLVIDGDGMTESEVDEAATRSVEIISKRVKEFGIYRPVVRREGPDRILVQLPGSMDADRKNDMVIRTARLEFRLVRNNEILTETIEALDEALGSVVTELEDTEIAMPDETFESRPFSSCLSPSRHGDTFVAERYIETIKSFLETPEADSAIPPESEFVWASQASPLPNGEMGKAIYLLNKESHLAGCGISGVKTERDHENPSFSVVTIAFDGEGRRLLSRLTGDHVGEKLAIVVDDRVYMAPVIQMKVPDGRCIISGGLSEAEAHDLAIMLKAGELPASLKILDQRIVTPGS